MCAQIRDKFDERRPICPRTDRIGAIVGVRQSSTKFDQQLPEIYQRFPEHHPHRRKLADSTELGQSSAEFDKTWPGTDQIWGRVRPNLARIGPIVDHPARRNDDAPGKAIEQLSVCFFAIALSLTLPAHRTANSTVLSKLQHQRARQRRFRPHAQRAVQWRATVEAEVGMTMVVFPVNAIVRVGGACASDIRRRAREACPTRFAARARARKRRQCDWVGDGRASEYRPPFSTHC